jgi:hypothetical protein
MAFALLPLGELILEGIGAGLATNMTNEVINTFKPIVSRKIGTEIADYAKNHPKGFLAQSLDSATKTRFQAIQDSNKAKIKAKAKPPPQPRQPPKRKIYYDDSDDDDDDYNYRYKQTHRYGHFPRKGHRVSRH